MRKPDSAIFVSAVMLSIGLLALVPASLRWASTWRDLNIPMPGVSVQNFFMPMGFFSLGLEAVGLITLWTAYQRGERSAWFLMLIITGFLIVPMNGLTLLLELHANIQTWANLWHGATSGNGYSIWKLAGALNVLWMLAGLTVPLRHFFRNQQNEAA